MTTCQERYTLWVDKVIVPTKDCLGCEDLYDCFYLFRRFCREDCPTKVHTDKDVLCQCANYDGSLS